MSRKTLQIIFFALGIFFFEARSAFAQSGENSIQVAIRAISFLKPSLTGTVTVAIIYEPGDADSEKEARAIERSLASSHSFGSMSLRPKRVSANSLEQLSGSKIAFVTKGTNYRQIAAVSSSRSILTISFDPACTRAGQCVLMVGSQPKVQIVVSRSAAAAARLRFNSSFLMLIKEI